jgi:hypothetical protein
MPRLVMPGIGRRITRMVISNGLELACKRMTVRPFKIGVRIRLEHSKVIISGNRGGSPLPRHSRSFNGWSLLASELQLFMAF